MSNLSLRRLTEVLNALIARCDAAQTTDGHAIDDESQRMRVEVWFGPHGPPPLETMEEAASLCDQVGLGGAAKQLRDDAFELLRDWTDIHFCELSRSATPEEILFYQQTYGPFPLPLADTTHDGEVNRDRWAALFGKIVLLGEFVRSLAKSVDRETTSDAVGMKTTASPRRSTEPGEVRLMIISALMAHHDYHNGSCGNLEPMRVSDLVRLGVASKGGASGFFKEHFGSHAKYKAECMDAGRLAFALKQLNGENTPGSLFKQLSEFAEAIKQGNSGAGVDE